MSVAVLLRKIDEGVAEVHDRYEAARAATTVSDETLYTIRSVVQDCQSALDWTATAVREKHYPAARWGPYFPLARRLADFPKQMEKQIKGLLTDQPDIAAAFARHQPYCAGQAELGHLRALSRRNKHWGFTAQERTVRWRLDMVGRAISGVDLDPTTLLTVDDPRRPYIEVRHVEWCFLTPSVAVLPTLAALRRQVRDAVEDIRRVAKV